MSRAFAYILLHDILMGFPSKSHSDGQAARIQLGIAELSVIGPSALGLQLYPIHFIVSSRLPYKAVCLMPSVMSLWSTRRRPWSLRSWQSGQDFAVNLRKSKK